MDEEFTVKKNQALLLSEFDVTAEQVKELYTSESLSRCNMDDAGTLGLWLKYAPRRKTAGNLNGELVKLWT